MAGKLRGHKTHGPILSAREIRFCQLLVTEDLSQHDAYVKAGLPAKETRRATEQAAHRLVKKRVVREYLRHLQRVASEAARVTTEEIAAGIANIATADRRKVWKGGRLLPPDQWPDDVAATVEAIEAEELYEPVPGAKGQRRIKSRVNKVKTASRLAAWSKLAEWKGMTGADRQDAGKAAPDPLTVSEDTEPEATPGGGP